MAFLSIGCVVAADQRDDCILLRIDDGMFNNAFKTLTLKPSSKAAPRIGDCIVYTTDKEERRIVEFGSNCSLMNLLNRNTE